MSWLGNVVGTTALTFVKLQALQGQKHPIDQSLSTHSSFDAPGQKNMRWEGATGPHSGCVLGYNAFLFAYRVVPCLKSENVR